MLFVHFIRWRLLQDTLSEHMCPLIHIWWINQHSQQHPNFPLTHTLPVPNLAPVHTNPRSHKHTLIHRAGRYRDHLNMLIENSTSLTPVCDFYLTWPKTWRYIRSITKGHNQRNFIVKLSLSHDMVICLYIYIYICNQIFCKIQIPNMLQIEYV